MNKFTKVLLTLGLVTFNALFGAKQELEAQYEQNPAIMKAIKQVAADTVTQKIVKQEYGGPCPFDFVLLKRLIEFDYTEAAQQVINNIQDKQLAVGALKSLLREEAITYATKKDEKGNAWSGINDKEDYGILINLLEEEEYRLVKFLLELGLDPNETIIDSSDKHKSIRRRTTPYGTYTVDALSVAIKANRTDVVKLFLEKKATVDEHVINIAKADSEIKELLLSAHSAQSRPSVLQQKHVQFVEPHTDSDLSKSKLNENNHSSIKDAHHQTKQQTPPHKSKTSENQHDNSSDSEPNSWLSLKNTLIGGAIITGVAATVYLVKWLHIKWKMRTTRLA